MEFVTLNFKYLLSLITILVTINFNLYCVNSSEIISSIKTNTLLKKKSTTKNSSKTLIRNKSKVTYQKKKYFDNWAPGDNKVYHVRAQLVKIKDSLKKAKLNPNKTTSKKPTNLIHNLEKITDATKDVLFNDWLMISSKGFNQHYPEIDMGEIMSRLKLILLIIE